MGGFSDKLKDGYKTFSEYFNNKYSDDETEENESNEENEDEEVEEENEDE